MSQLSDGVARAESRDQTFATMAKLLFVCGLPGSSKVRIEGYLTGLLERRVTQKQTLHIIQHGFLFLKMRQQWILRVDILEILEVHQIHIGEVKRVVKRRLHRRQQQALWNKGNVNVVIWSELAVTNCSLTINASAIKTYLRIAIYLIWLSGGTAPWSSTSAHCLTRNSTENLNKFGQLHAAKWTLHTR